MLGQEGLDGLLQSGLGLGLGDAGAQAVEAQQVGQHAKKAWPQQIAALGEYGVEVAAAPFQPGRRHLHRERHFGRGGGHGQLIEQAYQLRVGGVVEHQKAGVHAVAHALQRHVHRVGMATEVVIGLEKHQIDIGRQLPGSGQAGDARPHHSHTLAAAGGHVTQRRATAGWQEKSAVQRPETNEGGREEEEMGLGISSRKSERLHGFKNWACAGFGFQRPRQPLGLDFDQRWLVLSRGAWNGSGLCGRRFMGGWKSVGRYVRGCLDVGL